MSTKIIQFMSRMRKTGLLTAIMTSLMSFAMVGSATAAAATKSVGGAPAVATSGLAAIIAKGDQEINRRLVTLKTLNAKISGTTQLSKANKAVLTTEVNTETSSLTALKTKLDAETTVAAAAGDAQLITNDYRVYALIVPKVQLIRVADDQQAIDAKLATLATKLQTRITSAQKNGKNVAALQSQLATFNHRVTDAVTLSDAVEPKIIPLQPTDYNNDHALLTGYAAQLKTAHTDNSVALTTAQAIVTSLKSL